MPRFKGTPEERFWSKVDKGPHPGGCWLWTAYIQKSWGYGVFGIKRNGKDGTVLAHRHSWFLVNGEVPDGMLVCHSCDNPRCVNPDHLWVGTNNDNMQDMKQKGRGKSRQGSRHPTSRMTEWHAAEIWRRCRILHHRRDIVSQELGVSMSAVKRVVSREAWRHVTDSLP